MSEIERIDFVKQQRGDEGLKLWLDQTISIYRKAVLDKSHFASNNHYRRKFIESYIELKRFRDYRNK